MYKVDYLQSNPNQLDRVTKFVKESHLTQPHLISPESKNMPSNLVTIPSLVPRNIEPLYLSLLINGFKLSNCVIDLGASNNVMPAKVANSLGLTLKKSFGKIKDAQFSFVSFLEKNIKMIFLVVDVPSSYGMLLVHNFYKEVSSELNTDMSEARKPIKGVMQKSHPGREIKYVVVESNDPHSQIIF